MSEASITEADWPAAFPPPVPRDADAPFWQSIAERRMALQHCEDCGHVRYPAASHCPECLSERTAWRALSGKASLVTWCTFHRQYLDAFPPPHKVAVARLAEGPLFVAMFLDAVADGDAGTDLDIVYVSDPTGRILPAFRRCDIA